MSWSCPHEANGFCRRRRKTCEPLAKNCVLGGKGLVLASTKAPSGREKEHINVNRKGTEINVRIIQHVPFEGIGSISR